MTNFTKSTITIGEATWYRYTADRKRGGATWVFFNIAPHDKAYDPTWPKYVESNEAFVGVPFHSCIEENNIHVDFMDELTTNEENALDTLYENQVGPVVS